jgi:hypothetical protein
VVVEMMVQTASSVPVPVAVFPVLPHSLAVFVTLPLHLLVG